MKAIELPINALVIVVIVIVVLLAVISLFFGVWTPSGSMTTLESITQSTCMRVNPTFCQSEPNPPYANMYAARMPVYDFDANKNGILNEHNQDGQWATSYQDDNLEMLCDNYYYCGPPSLITEADWKSWIGCCVKKVCGCP
jgi:hypothetical protein